MNCLISMMLSPVPVKFFLSVPPLAAVTVMEPTRSPLAVGLNTMDTVHWSPPAKDLPAQSVAAVPGVVAKSPVAVRVRAPEASVPPLALETVHTLAVEMRPTTVSSKSYEGQVMLMPGLVRAVPATVRSGDE